MGGCEERSLLRSQTGEARLSCKANKYSDWGTSLFYLHTKHHHALVMPA